MRGKSISMGLCAACVVALAMSVSGGVNTALAADAAPRYPELNMGLKPDPEKGADILLNAVMSSAVFKEKDIPRLWQIWESAEYARAEAATPEERHRMTFERYGWTESPDPERRSIPLGYTRDGKGGMVTNCHVCHTGRVGGQTIFGAGNTHVDLTALATDVAKLSALDRGRDPEKVADVQAPFKTPLSVHKGTTNAVVFAHVFAGLRNPELARQYIADPTLLKHHDMNPPAWWNFKYKNKIYCDAFAPPTPRQLMPFAMSPLFTDEKFHSFESNFVHIKAYIESLEPPKYPYAIDEALAARGKPLFEKSCSECHGTYGAKARYPNIVPKWEKVETDRVRLDSISKENRVSANGSWLQYDGKYAVNEDTKGYIPQPLHGIWATAPYFHNGSVPTLHHVFNIDERPAVWKRDEDGYDTERVGLRIEELDAVPEGLNTREQRMYYDTSVSGSAASGHTFPDDEFDADEKAAVMEYLKTL